MPRPAYLNLALWVVSLSVIAVGWIVRLPRAVDLMDEPYYANLITTLDGPNGDECVSPHLPYAVVHKTIARIVRTDPTVLIENRYLYLGMHTLSIGILFLALRRVLPTYVLLGPILVAWMYTPFSLPCLSYNTLGTIGFTVGLSLLNLSSDTRRSRLIMTTLAALVIAIAAVGYPPLIALGVLAFLAQAWLTRRLKESLITVPILVVLFVGLFGLTIMALGGRSRFESIVAFTTSLDTYSSITSKLTRMVDLIAKEKIYLGLSAITSVIAILASLFPRRLWTGLMAALLIAGPIAIALRPIPSLFTHNHDLVFFLALTGLPLLRSLMLRDEPVGQVLSLFYLCGLAGGFMTSVSASNSLYNFSVLGGLAAIAGFAYWLSRLDLGLSFRSLGIMLLVGGPTVGVTGWDAFVHPYGIYDEQGQGVTTIPSGRYRALKTNPDLVKLLVSTEELAQSYGEGITTVDFFGRVPGCYLVTPYRLRSPMAAWPLKFDATHGADATLERYYEPESRRPDLIFWFRDDSRYDRPNASQIKLVEQHYLPVDDYSGYTIYRRKDLTGPRFVAHKHPDYPHTLSVAVDVTSADPNAGVVQFTCGETTIRRDSAFPWLVDFHLSNGTGQPLFTGTQNKYRIGIFTRRPDGTRLHDLHGVYFPETLDPAGSRVVVPHEVPLPESVEDYELVIDVVDVTREYWLHHRTSKPLVLKVRVR